MPDKCGEKEAIACGLAILGGKYEGESDFARGMRLLQEKIRGKADAR